MTSPYLRRLRIQHLTTKAIIVTVLICFEIILSLNQILHNAHLANFNGGDGGVYYAATYNLIHGVLPYRNFVFLQPPLILIILSPFALLGEVTSIRLGFETARLFVYLVELGNCFLMLWIIRWQNPIRVAIGLGILILSVDMLQTTATILLEPFLILCCLGGTALLFEQSEITKSLRRVLSSGIFFGLAGATKLWAIVPVLVLFIILLFKDRKNTFWFFLGVTASFALVILPFIFLCPSQLIHQVILTQAARTREPPSTFGRLLTFVGFPGFSQVLYPAFFTIVSSLLLIIGSILTVHSQLLIRPRRRQPLETFALWTVLLSASMLLLARPFFFHYPAFLTPFVSLLLAVQPYAYPSKTKSRTHISISTPVIIASTVSLMLATATLDYYRAEDSPTGTYSLPVQYMDNIVRKGCILAWPVSFALLTNQYTGYLPSCPHTVDWYGTERYYAPGKSVNSDSLIQNVSFQKVVLSWLEKSSTVMLGFSNLGIGTNDTRYIDTHFRLLNKGPGLAYQAIFHILIGVRVTPSGISKTT